MQRMARTIVALVRQSASATPTTASTTDRNVVVALNGTDGAAVARARVDYRWRRKASSTRRTGVRGGRLQRLRRSPPPFRSSSSPRTDDVRARQRGPGGDYECAHAYLGLRQRLLVQTADRPS